MGEEKGTGVENAVDRRVSPFDPRPLFFSKARLKRGGDRLQVGLTDVRDERHSRAIGPKQLLELDEALGKLEEADQQVAELVRLRLYAGLSITEAAKVTGISRTVAYERWDYAMSWFAIELGDPRPM